MYVSMAWINIVEAIMHKKNILFVIDSMGIGGAEKVVLTLAKSFLDRDHHVSLIICDNIVKFEVDARIDLHVLGFKKSFMDYTKYSKNLHAMIDKIEVNNDFTFDLIFAHLQKATKLLKGYRHRNIYDVVHSTLSQSAFANRTGLRLWLKKRTLQKIYNGLNIIAVSQGVQDDLVNIIGIKPKSIQTISNPVNMDEIQALSRERLIIAEEDYIVHVGRFHSVKRHDILLKAYKKSGISAKLVLVGDGEEIANIEKLITDLELKERVVLTGFMQNPYPIIKNAKLLVLSSEYEGFGIVLVESLLLGTPVVSTNCKSGPNEILVGSYAKYLAQVGDVDDLADKISEVYKDRYVIDKKMLKKFELQDIMKQYMALI